MEKKNVIDKRSVKLENILNKDYIGFLEGRPERNTVIGKDDIANLKIALNTGLGFEEFISGM